MGASSLGGVGSRERGEMARAGETQVEGKVGASSLSSSAPEQTEQGQ